LDLLNLINKYFKNSIKLLPTDYLLTLKPNSLQ